MIDYKLLDALTAVLDQGGFERGARHLGLTQSAVSQRIKLLEARLGSIGTTGDRGAKYSMR